MAPHSGHRRSQLRICSCFRAQRDLGFTPVTLRASPPSQSPYLHPAMHPSMDRRRLTLYGHRFPGRSRQQILLPPGCRSARRNKLVEFPLSRLRVRAEAPYELPHSV